MQIRAKLAIAILLLTGLVVTARAQTGASIYGQAMTPYGTPAANARIWVCPYTATGTPCTPTSNIYSDPSLTQQITQPYAADQYGNFTVFVDPGMYLVQVQINQTVYYSYTISASNAGSQFLALKHNGTNLANQTVLNFNDTAPAAPSGYTNVLWQSDAGGDVSAYALTPGCAAANCLVTNPTGTQNTTALTLTNKNLCLQDGTNCPGGYVAGSSFVVFGSTIPWNPALPGNSAYPFANGSGGSYAGTPPIVVAAALTAGQTITISATGLDNAGSQQWPNYGPVGGSYVAPGGFTLHCPTDSTYGTFPESYISGNTCTGPLLFMGLMGAFTDSSGNVKEVVGIGSAASLTVPTGATQLQLGVNDIYFPDNSGLFSVVISVNGQSILNPGSGLVSVNTNGNPNALQTVLNFTNPSSFNGLTFTFSNPAQGNETFAVGGSLAPSGLAPQAANTVLGNAGAATASPSPIAMPSCSGANQAINWTSGVGPGCTTISGGGSGTVTDGSGTTTANQIATSTTTSHQIQYGTALPNGTTATTQTTGDNTTKVATDAFVIANAGSGGGTTVDILSGQKPTGTPLFIPTIERRAVTAAQTITIVSETGSGYISRIFIACSVLNNFRNATVQVTVNGDASPNISEPLWAFLGSFPVPDGSANFFQNALFGANGNGTNEFSGFRLLPIPYANGITITITFPSADTVFMNAEGQGGVTDNFPYTRKLWEQSNYFNASSQVTLINQPEMLANYAGANPGRIVGVSIGSFWFAGNISPAPADFEGNVRVYVDTFTKTWSATTAYSVGDTIMDPNGNLETVSTAGTSGSTEPTTWSFLKGTTADGAGTLVWTETPGDPPTVWRASSPYTTVGQMAVLDSNGNVEVLTTAGTSAGSPPTWNATVGGTTTDGTNVWTNVGSTYIHSIQSSGTEDFFGQGFYADKVPGGQGLYTGLTITETYGKEMSRLFLPDPLRFAHSFAIFRQMGDSSQVNFTGWTGNPTEVEWYTQDTN